MEKNNISNDPIDIQNELNPINNSISTSYEQNPNLRPKSQIAGFLLIISGVFVILYSLYAVTTFDVTISMMDISQLQEIDPNITPEQIRDMLILCTTLLSALSIITILGGILALKRKLWGIALTGAILGLTGFIAMLIPGILALTALIILILAKKEFE